MVSALGLGIHQIVMIFNFYGILSTEYVRAGEGVTAIVTSLSLAYATYGLYVSMRRIRERLSEER